MYKGKKILVVIPARGGSKRIPRKNIKMLNGKPLIGYSIDVARQLVDDEDICVSTDDKEIKDVVEQYGLKVPFLRPGFLATDEVGSYEVLLHALNYYEEMGCKYDIVLLLQTTSPFRKIDHIREALDLYNSQIDMVVSVKKISSNPYYNSFEEDVEGYLHVSKGDGVYISKKDVPQAWEYNGAVYVINPNSLRQSPLSKFKKRVKYIMDDYYSLDLDTMFDWNVAEYMLGNHMLEL